MAFVFFFQIIFSLSIAGKFGVTGVPTLILFYNGRPVAKFNRTRSLQGLEDFISHATGMSKQMFHLFFSTEQACLDVLKMILLCGTMWLCLAARMAQLLEVPSTDPRVLGSSPQHDQTSNENEESHQLSVIPCRNHVGITR